MGNKNIPILGPVDLVKHYFGDSIKQPGFAPFNKGFHINLVETYRDQIVFPLPPHRKTVYDFTLLTKGTCNRSKGLNACTINTNCVFFQPANQITSDEGISNDAEGYYGYFDIEIFKTIFPDNKIFSQFAFLQFNGDPLVEFDEQGKELLVNILSRLEREYNAKRSDSFELIATYLMSFFLELNKYAQPVSAIKSNAALSITQQYKSDLAQYIYDKQMVTDYAKMLSVTSNHLNKCVKSITGKSAQDLLNEMVLLEAKVLLKQTGLQVSEIAHKLTEQNPGDFCRFFKSRTGITPTQFRQISV